jgi:pyocin large subunit-like protein
MRHILTATAALAAVFAITACDGGPASKPSRDQVDAGSASAPKAGRTETASADSPDRTETPKVDPRTQPPPMLDGKPMWAANRKLTAEEAAERQFTRHGQDFAARSVEDYARKAQAFVSNPPKGAEVVEVRRGKIMYDAKSNTFAAATKDGVPRTMFKPEEGAAYWEKAKTQPEGGGRRRQRQGSDNEG